MATPTTPASTSAAPATQGTIVFVQGEAYLRDRQGKLQAIKPGDAVAEGQEIVTAAGAVVDVIQIPAFLCRQINDLLDLFGINFSVVPDPVLCEDIGSAQFLKLRHPYIIKPVIYGSSVREIFRRSFFFVMHSLPPLRSAPSENEHRISALIVIVGYLISTKVVS